MNVCSKVGKLGTFRREPPRTSTATIANVKTSPSLLTGPPPRTSGAAHADMLPALESHWTLVIELSPRMMGINPKSVSRAWPFPSIRMFAFKFVVVNI